MADRRGDQAAGLRRLFAREQLRIITFAAGCEGVGKSLAVVNLAATFARQGREVLILDENTVNNTAAHLGVAARHDLYHVLNRDRALNDVLVQAVPGVRILPAARAVKKLGKLTLSEQEALLQALSAMELPADVILVDASTDHPLGFSPFGLATQETVVVLSASGSSITDAYALIKKVSLGYARRHFRILVGKARHGEEAAAIFGNLQRVSRQRGVARLDYAGFVPLDDALRSAQRLAMPVIEAFPESVAAGAFRALASDMMQWPPSGLEGGGIEQFLQQLLHFSQRMDPVPIHVG